MITKLKKELKLAKTFRQRELIGRKITLMEKQDPEISHSANKNYVAKMAKRLYDADNRMTVKTLLEKAISDTRHVILNNLQNHWPDGSLEEAVLEAKMPWLP